MTSPKIVPNTACYAGFLVDYHPTQVFADTAYQNARRNSDAQNARIEHDAALRRSITSMARSNAELYKTYTENPSFRSWLNDQMFWLTYLDDASP